MRETLQKLAQEVHDQLGPGFTESIYHTALERELSDAGIGFHSEGTIPVMYKGAPVGRRRPDLFVITEYGTIIIELKAGSSSGSEQLEQYVGMAVEDNNLGDIVGSAVIRFNDSLEFEYSGVNNVK